MKKSPTLKPILMLCLGYVLDLSGTFIFEKSPSGKKIIG